MILITKDGKESLQRAAWKERYTHKIFCYLALFFTILVFFRFAGCPDFCQPSAIALSQGKCLDKIEFRGITHLNLLPCSPQGQLWKVDRDGMHAQYTYITTSSWQGHES